MLHTLLSLWIHLSFAKFPSRIHSGTMLHLYTELLALHTSRKQPLSAIRKLHFIQHPTTFLKLNSPKSCSGSHSSLTSSTPTSSPCHPDMQALLLFPVHHITFFPAPLTLNKFLHVFCMQNFSKTFGHPLQSTTFNLDPLTTLYTQN